MSRAREKTDIGFFEHYLSVWVLLCMAAGVLIGNFLPGIPEFLGRFEYANVSIPIAVLIWLMIYPMMLKVDFRSIRNVRNKYRPSAYAGHYLLDPGKSDSRKAAAHCPDRRTAGHPDLSDFLYCVSGKPRIEAAVRHCGSCGHDRRFELFRACRRRRGLPVRRFESRRTRHNSRSAGRSAGYADPCPNRQ